MMPTANQIIGAVANEFDLPLVHLLGQRRDQTVSRPRHLTAWLIIKLTGASYPQIGRLMGRRDHTTIMHSVRRAEDLLHTDPLYRGHCLRVLRRFERRQAWGV